MKNSLFKRAVAAVATVPLALTQCLSIAQAVYVDEASNTPAVTADTANGSWTLDKGEANSIFYISPDEGNEHETYELGNGVLSAEELGKDKTKTFDGYYYQNSAWNFKVLEILQQIAASDTKTDEIDATPIFDKIKASAGNDDVAAIIEKIKDLRYTVTDDGDIHITGELENIVPVFTENATASLGAQISAAIDAIREEYSDLIEAGIISDDDFPSADNVEDIFKDLVIGCKVRATIKGSDLAEGNLMHAEVVLTDTATGKPYRGTGAVDWVLDSIENLNKSVEDAFADFEEFGVDPDEVKKKITDATAPYVDKLNKAKELESKVLSYSTETYTFGTTTDAIAKAYEIADSKKDKIDKAIDKAEDLTHKNLPDELPRYSSVSEIFSNSKVVDVYSKVLNNINEKVAGIVSFDVSPEEVGIFADGAYDITVSLTNGIAIFSAKFPDAEADAAAAFVSENFGVDVNAEDIYKKVDVTADFSTIQDSAGGSASVQVDFQRIVPFVTTSTTTAVTTTSTTTADTVTTTASTDVSDVTTTATEDVIGSDVTTTATDDVIGSDVTTTATDDVIGSDVTTTATDDVIGSDVTTTATDDVIGSDVTTTATDDVIGSDVTTTATDDVIGSDVTTTATDDVIGSDVTTTATNVSGVPGTTTAVVSDVVNVFLDADAGFYLNIDTEFHTEQVKSLKYRIDRSTVYIDENGEIVGQEIITEGTPVDITNSFTIKNTPAGVYNEVMENGVKQFVHSVPLYATKDIIDEETGTVIATANQQIKYYNGARVSITAYVGVKGDADFDLKADSTDASAVLMWYAKASVSNGNPEILENTKFSTAKLSLDMYPLMDDFAAFLCDVDNENSSDNWNLKKPARVIDSSDASFILVLYAKTSTGSVDDRATWNEVLGKWAKN